MTDSAEEPRHETNEALRKVLHIGMGFGALLLLRLPWRYAALIGTAAIIGNWLLLHRIAGRGVSRHERGWDIGIILYPFSVTVLIVVFNWHIEIAAVAWVLLAFGDGFATVIGQRLPLAPLPWNRAKSWGGAIAFVLFGGAAAFAIARLFGAPQDVAIAAAVLISAIAESLPLGLDDNVTVPFIAAGVLAAMAIKPIVSLSAAPPIAWPWLVVNTVLAIVGYALRGVNVSGALAGWILGCVIIIGGGPPLYGALLTFFIIGTLATKLGYARKAGDGLAQEGGGRRGAAHAFANVGVAAICAVACWRGLGFVPLFMGIAALATAAADTVSSEVGQLLGRRAFLPLSFRRVERGTEGAISIEGTLAGIIAGGIVAIVGTALTVHNFRAGFIGGVVIDKSNVILVLTGCAFLGSYLESILGSWNRRHGSPISNGALNFVNTLLGAFLFWVAWHWVPMFGFEF
ncbi:MAG TPA: DUF92 domain-containing protein [Thermoanaerobaculia bacterium]|jgi:uncharacterized protein (TIGR00297 family)|nr:DUF92 domain-containing protein [Thermoanaerobaculia bacterium]